MRARAGPAPLRITAVAVAGGLAAVLSWPAGAAAGAASVHRPSALDAIVLAEVGFGYTVTSQGPLDTSRFPAGSPSAAAAAGALSTLGNSIDTYQRIWQDATAVNQAQELMVRFPTGAAALAFVNAARRAITHGKIVSSGPLSSIPGARRATYFASTDQAGVGQTITFRVGDYAAVLSFFSGASGNPAPITPASAERVARAQYAAVASVADAGAAKKVPGGGLSASDAGWAVLALAVLTAAVVTPLVRRRRRGSD
jgi:hypothetical protein